MAQLTAMQKKEVRTDSLWTDMCQGKRVRRSEIDSNAEAAMFAPSVRPSCVWVEGGGVFPG